MKTIKRLKMRLVKTVLLMGAMIAFSAPAFAHCDSYDGPVIQDAYKALEKEEAKYVMKWIDTEHEAEIKRALATPGSEIPEVLVPLSLRNNVIKSR